MTSLLGVDEFGGALLFEKLIENYVFSVNYYI
jgi:hypothetical protein